MAASDKNTVTLFDADGNELSVLDGAVLAVGTPGILVHGTDGANTRRIRTDSTGRPVQVGAGTAGVPVGGILTIQGDPAGSAIPITGSITATNPSVGTNATAIPTSSTQVGGSDGVNLQAVRVYDLDTGVGSEYNVGVNLRKSAGGGSVEFGTLADPVRVDPTGTTTQPISAVALPLPTGAATEATLLTRATEATLATRATEATLLTRATEVTLATRLADATFTSRINTLGQKTMALSTPVVIASDQSVIPVSDNGGSLTVDGTVTANQGTATGAAAPWSVRLSDGAAFYDGTKTGQLPTVLVGGRLDTNVGAWLGSTAPTVGQKVMTSSVPVVIASDQSAVPTTISGQAADNSANSVTKLPVLAARANAANPTWTEGNQVPLSADLTGHVRVRTQAPIGTTTSVASSVANVTLLAANANRKGATIYNDGTQNLFVKLGATASTVDFTVRITSQGYYEVPFGYTGIIDGIWNVANGSARITEIT